MREMNRRANRLAAMRGGIQPRQAVLGVRARGTKGLVPHAAMCSPASEQAALTYTVKLIQEGPTLLKLIVKKEISENADNVYLIAHGGLIVNNNVFCGKHYLWNENDVVEERIFPTGKAPGIDIHTLGANMNNVFGCYISSAVRKVPKRVFFKTQYTSSVDDYGRMYEDLYNRLARYTVNPHPKECLIRIRIFEGENANEANKSYAKTENALRIRPIRDEEEYK